jgi:nucleoside-diphosphate-sugar epimerase
MRTVLVTGASGSIGSAICHHLAEEGWRVVAQGRSRPPEGTGERQVATGPFHGEVDWREALEGVDCIVHGAALTWVEERDETKALAEFRRVNVDASAALMRDAAKADVRRVIYISSMTVHGAYAGQPFRPDDTLRPDSLYARSKAEAEEALRELGARHSIEIVVLRLPLVIGPEYSGNMARLARLVERGVPLPFGAVRRNRRCRLSRDNLLRAIELALEAPGAAGKTLLLSDGKPQSTRAMVEEIGERVGRRPRLLPVPSWLLRALVSLLPQSLLGKLSRHAMAEELVGDYEIDITRTRDVLGYRPE